ncbi:Carnitine monooxygenase oxygenase subunit [Sinobacterium norvegicum]|uniref:Carnitine monooxygenase oxygenase subunit n=1 Tax=Sinobacterium norvegicum TaxID=1641715 RepID=A0ABM9AIN1_9GAMM|nr:aromatic ring-hydroxylating dioxygenase subunit alpha [Sinobacterium norvegicum]CAH0993080.1 Carnitine monooxygenase oxygenase subunit [Sinobacterium norvegicum]
MSTKVTLTDEQIAARDPSDSFQDLLKIETVEVPAALLESTDTYLGSEDIAISRYISQDFFDLEVEKVWRKTWQAACRVNRLREAGDYFVYDIVDDSILLTRTESGELKGYHNSCLHRGRALKRGSGNSDKIRCPYHAWSWDLDGEFKGAPCEWDFPHVNKENTKLPEVKVETWGGWVFINMDENAPSLKDYMEVLPQHMDQWKHEQRFVAAHVEKVIACNWKAGLEAFIESYHALATHPQILPYQGIDNSQYDVWGDHVSRSISAYGVVNPSHNDQFSEQDCLDGMMAMIGSEERPQLAPGQTAREAYALMNLPAANEAAGEDFTDRTTMSELMDSTLYSLFPNLAPWAGNGTVITYRHRPNGNDVDSCIMDVFILARFPEGTESPPDAATFRLESDQPFTEAAEVLGAGLANVFNQDGANLPQVQRGMKSSKKGMVTLGNYQEVRIRHFHQTIDKYLAK